VPLIGALLLAPSVALAGRVAVERRVTVSFAKSDKSKLSGRVASYNETSFELVKADSEHVEVKWSELDASNLSLVRSALITAKPDAQAWLNLGRELRRLPGGEKLAEKAFDNAYRDPKLKSAVDAARKEPIKPLGEAAEQDPAGPWKLLNADEQAKALQELETFAADTKKAMNLELSRQETDYFLIYSDLKSTEAKKSAELLDRMYLKLAELFATGKGVNIWRGKALVFVFKESKDYKRFQGLMHKTDPGGAFGMCHNFPNGEVHIAFYRQPDEKAFTHVLVHESVHGFLHRFRTPASVPSWINEGLAETVAMELVPRHFSPDDDLAATKAAAKTGVESHGTSLGGMFDAKPIDDWQYPVAQSITEFLIRRNRRGYVSFIVAIKDGMSWPDALSEKLKADRAALVKGFGDDWLKVKGLKP